MRKIFEKSGRAQVRSAQAFTLVEVIIAITVFTIFIGFVMSGYLAFHRAEQEALTARSLLFEIESAQDTVVELAKENKIDYVAYADEDRYGNDVLSQLVRGNVFGDLVMINAMHTETLRLISADGQTSYTIFWDAEAETLSLTESDVDAVAGDAGDAILLHSEETRVDYVSFKIFPDENPFLTENSDRSDLQYQPYVQIYISFVRPGRVRDEVTIDLQTTVTSRFYQ